MFYNFLKCLHWNDWDTLAYWITAIATFFLLCIGLWKKKSPLINSKRNKGIIAGGNITAGGDIIIGTEKENKYLEEYKTKLSIEYRQELIKLNDLFKKLNYDNCNKLIELDFQEKVKSVNTVFNEALTVIRNNDKNRYNYSVGRSTSQFFHMEDEANRIFKLVMNQYSTINEIVELNKKYKINKDIFKEIKNLNILQINSNYKVYYEKTNDAKHFNSFIDLYNAFIKLDVDNLFKELYLGNITLYSSSYTELNEFEMYDLIEERFTETFDNTSLYFSKLNEYKQICEDISNLNKLNLELIEYFIKKRIKNEKSKSNRHPNSTGNRQ